MGVERRQYAVSIERFDFFQRIYCVPSNPAIEPASEYVPFKDAMHAWRICQRVASAANESPAATASKTPKVVSLSASPGSGWTRKA